MSELMIEKIIGRIKSVVCDACNPIGKEGHCKAHGERCHGLYAEQAEHIHAHVVQPLEDEIERMCVALKLAQARAKDMQELLKEIYGDLQPDNPSDAPVCPVCWRHDANGHKDWCYFPRLEAMVKGDAK